MAFSKTLKTWLIIIAIPVVLLTVGVIALKLYLTGGRLKAMVIPRIEEATHRNVTIGDISLSLFPTFGISIEKLSISNPERFTFDRDEFLSLDKLLFDVKILPLLQNRLEINEIIIERPKLYLELTSEGTKNYSIKPKLGERDTVTITAGGGGTFLLSNLRIVDGEIEYIDKKFNSRAVLTGYNQKARVEIRPGGKDANIETEVSIDKFSFGTLNTYYLQDLPIKLSARLTYGLDKDALVLDSVTVSLKELPLVVKGTVEAFKKVPMLDILVTSQQVEMNSLLSLVPPEKLKASKGLNSSGDVRFSLTIKGESSEIMNPGIVGSFTVVNGKVQYASLPKTVTNINIAGTFEKPAAPIGATGIGEFAVEKFSAMLGNNEVTGKLKMTNFDDPMIAGAVNGNINLNEVKEYYPLEEGTSLMGVMKANITLEGKAKIPMSIKASGQVVFENVTIKTPSSTKPLRNLNGTIQFNNQIVESKQLAMNIGESDLKLSFVLKNYLSMVMKEAKSSGKPNATATLTSKVLQTADLTSEPSVPAESVAKKGSEKQATLLPGFDIDANVSIDRFVTEKFEFKNARGTVLLSEGAAILKNFTVNAFQGTIITKGKLDARDPEKRSFDFDLQIIGVEANEFLPKFTSFGRSLFGKFSMTTKLQGDLNDTLGLNTQSLMGSGGVQIFDGRLVGFALTGKLAEFTGLSELSEVNFKNWSNTFEISNGRIDIKDLRVNAGATDFLVGGSQGLDGSLDYSLTVKLPESVSSRLRLQGVAGELLQFFKDKDGRFNLSFLVSGMSSSPTLKLDTKAQEEMAKKMLEQKAGDELKKKLNEGLKKLFKKD